MIKVIIKDQIQDDRRHVIVGLVVYKSDVKHVGLSILKAILIETVLKVNGVDM